MTKYILIDRLYIASHCECVGRCLCKVDADELRRSGWRHGNCAGASRDVTSCCADQRQVRHALSTATWTAHSHLLVSQSITPAPCTALALCNYYSAPDSEAEYCDDRVCLSASISPELQSDLTDFCACYLHMYVRGLVLLWRRRDTLCTSGLWMTSYLRIQARGSLTWPPSWSKYSPHAAFDLTNGA